MRTDRYDFIVIGGGASGCAVAGALSKRGTTLLLERGKAMEDEPLTQTDSGWPDVLCGSAVDRQPVQGGGWAFTGNVMGGGTSINAGVFLKEPDGRFFTEHPHLERSEVTQSYKNIGKVAFERKLPPVTSTVVEAMIGAGIGKFHNSCDTPLNGIFAPYTTFDRNGVRHSAAALLPAKGEEGFENLTIQTQAVVTRILFSSKDKQPRAIGVEYLDVKTDAAGARRQVFVESQGEVILSAGAIHSPKLLMLSGIGDPAHLKSLNIEPLVANPDVGLHLMDQPGLPMLVQCRTPVEKTMIDIAAVTDHLHFEQTSGGEIATVLGCLGILPASARTEKNKQRMERLFRLFTQEFRRDFNQSIILVAILKHPVTRGSVRLRSTDPRAHLEIHLPKFLDEREKETMIDAIRVLKRMVESHPMKESRKDQGRSRFILIQCARLYASLINLPIGKFTAESAVTYPPLPDLDFAPHEAEKRNSVLKWLNMMCIEGWHYVGTCQFGKVVDETFSVLGVSGLRVVDASVLKRPPTINPQSTLMMLGDYAGRVAISVPQSKVAAQTELR